MASSKKKTTSSSVVKKQDKHNNKRTHHHHESPLTQQLGLSNPTSSRSDTKRSSSNNKKKTTKKSKKARKEEAEERRLTSLLFGGGGGDFTTSDIRDDDDDDDGNDEIEQLTTENKNDEEEDEEPTSSSLMFEIDRTGASATGQDDEEDDEKEDDAQKDEGSDGEEEDSDDENNDDDDDEDGDDGRPAAWVDDDDEEVQVDLLNTHRLKKLRKSRSEDQPLSGADFQHRLRSRYKTTMQATAQTKWARLDEVDDEDNHDNNMDDTEETEITLQSSSQPLLVQGGNSNNARLPPNILNVMRCPDANQAEYNQAVVQAVNFHPGSDPNKPLLLTAGLDKTLRFFQVGPEKSEKIHGIHFPKLPIYSAHFLGETGKVVVSGRRPYFYLYDSIAGKLDHIPRILGREEKSLERCFPSPDGKIVAFAGNDGYVILVDVQSKQWMASLKMNGSVRAITFTPDGQYILASGSDGDVYRWDLRSRRCVERFTNQDGTITSFLAASTRRQLAVGSESGVVNLYTDEVSNSSSLLKKRRRSPAPSQHEPRAPLKSIMNLQTSADMMRYNHDGQILAMSSRREKDSLKLLHVPTATVFSNWPTSKTPLQYVSCMDFSPQSQFLAVGNDKGKCLLYQLQHYSQP